MRSAIINCIILDLDGPILDGRERHYACYAKILHDRGHTPMPIDEYWRMKRGRRDLREQLAASNSGEIYDSFRRQWLQEIESPQMLALDRIQPHAEEKLRQWRHAGVRLILVTLRRHSQNLHDQLRVLKLDSLFDRIIVTDHMRGASGKAEEIQRLIGNGDRDACLWIGDTEIDLEAARAVGCQICLVGCGLREASYLASLKPDFVASDLATIEFDVVSA